jgi:hypothetical protein
MPDLFTDTHCGRCHNELKAVRLMSWFTEDTICMSCSDKETVIKRALRAKGIADAMEGCGYVPSAD